LSSIKKIKESVVGQLQTKLPRHLVYHCVEHTLYVLDMVEIIGRKENVTSKELYLLKIAALYHDIGFIENHIDHEEISCRIAKKQLKKTLTDEQLALVCGMIMATKIPQSPNTKLDRIIADADLEYLGTKNFYTTGNLLFLELQYFNPKLTQKKWDEIQINFLSLHSYHTNFCKQYREKYKRKYLEELINNNS
jgi:uncharacterized protein